LNTAVMLVEVLGGAIFMGGGFLCGFSMFRRHCVLFSAEASTGILDTTLGLKRSETVFLVPMQPCPLVRDLGIGPL